MSTVSVLLIDSSRLFREGLRRLLDGTQFGIDAEAQSTPEAVRQLIDGMKPDLVLLEFDGSGGNAVEQVRMLRSQLGTTKIVVLTSRLSSRALAQLLEVGADGYLLKDMSIEALMQSLSLVMVGEKVFPTQLAELLVESKARPTRNAWHASAIPVGLSQREGAILRCLVHGLPNKVIADQLQMTEASVKVHLKAVLRKIHVSNRTQAAIWAINNGFKPDHAGGDID